MIMHTKHTPGPWKNTLTGIKANDKLIAQAWCGDTNDSFGNVPAVGHSEMKANARLIAAAPLLLEALKEAIANPRRLDKAATLYSIGQNLPLSERLQKEADWYAGIISAITKATVNPKTL